MSSELLCGVRIVSRSVLVCITLVAVASCSSGKDEISDDVLDTSAAVAVLKEIRQAAADAGLDGGNDLASSGGCPLAGSFTPTGEWSAEAGGTIVCELEGIALAVVGVGALPLGSIYPEAARRATRSQPLAGRLRPAAQPRPRTSTPPTRAWRCGRTVI